MMTNKFNIENPESLEYENGLLKITALGGIKIEGLDRMRATLKVELIKSSVPPIRHNLDLYNDTQLEKFIRKTSEKLETGANVIEGCLSELINHLERYRLEEIKKSEEPEFKTITLTAEQRKEAETFLSKPGLLKRTNELVGKSGVIGEETNRLLLYLIYTSRKRTSPLHAVCLGSSGTGKTHLQEKVGELIPEEERLSLTSLSENSFYYFGKQELRNKLILIEDLDGAENAMYPLRELQSKKRITKTIVHKNNKGETKPMHLVVEGPVSVSGCTTREKLYEDNANRSFLIYLDETQSQTGLIMDYQRKIASGSIDKVAELETMEFLKNTQRVLEPVAVRNPYAEQLNIPKEVFKPRRTNTHYLQFIEVVTYYHQYQRTRCVDKETGEEYIETTIEDIKEANHLLKETLLRKSDVLTGACRTHFQSLKAHLKEQKEERFTNRIISQQFRKPLSTIKRYHNQLFNAGYLNYEKDKETKSFYYEIADHLEYDNLKKSIDTVLDRIIGSLSAHPQSEPPKSKTISKKKD